MYYLSKLIENIKKKNVINKILIFLKYKISEYLYFIENLLFRELEKNDYVLCSFNNKRKYRYELKIRETKLNIYETREGKKCVFLNMFLFPNITLTDFICVWSLYIFQGEYYANCCKKLICFYQRIFSVCTFHKYK